PTSAGAPLIPDAKMRSEVTMLKRPRIICNTTAVIKPLERAIALLSFVLGCYLTVKPKTRVYAIAVPSAREQCHTLLGNFVLWSSSDCSNALCGNFTVRDAGWGYPSLILQRRQSEANGYRRKQR